MWQNRPQPPKVAPEFDLFGRLDDEHIPFPRTSGAYFSASGEGLKVTVSGLAESSMCIYACARVDCVLQHSIWTSCFWE